MSVTSPNPAAVLQPLMAVNLNNSIHPSFLAQILPDDFPEVKNFQNPYLKFKLQAHLVRYFGLEIISADVFLHNPYCELLIASPNQCSQLELILGALYHLDDIRKTINRLDKHHLIELLTPPIYTFILQQGILYAPMLKKIKVSMPRGDLITMIQSVGHFFLEYLWEQHPESLVKRFVLKMNASKQWNFRHIIDPLLQEHLFVIVKRLLHKLNTGALC